MKTFANFTPNLRFSQALTSFVSHFQTKQQAKTYFNQAHKTLAKKLEIPKTQVLLTYGARSAFYALLSTLKLNHKAANQVLIASFTCRVMLNPILKAELQPVFFDLNPENLRVDLEDLSSKLNSKTLAVVVQNTFGCHEDWQVIKKLIQQKSPKAKIIMDNAHMLPNKVEISDQKNFSDYALFSFGSNKIINAAGLGALVDFHRAISKSMQSHLQTLPQKHVHKQLCKNWIFKLSMPLYSIKIGKLMMFLANKLGMINKVVTPQEKSLQTQAITYYKAPEFLGLTLAHGLKFYQAELTHRVLIKSIYQCNLKDHFKFDKWFRKAPIFFPIKVKNPKKLAKKLLKHGFQVNLDWTGALLVPDSKVLPDSFKSDNYPGSQQINKHLLALPLNQTVSPNDAVKLVELINRYEK